MECVNKIKECFMNKVKRRKFIFMFFFLLIAVVIGILGPFVCGLQSEINSLNGILDELPSFVEGFKTEYEVQVNIYKEDIVAKGEIGLKYYMENPSQDLERIRNLCQAESISLVDEKWNIIDTTGLLTSAERFQEILLSLEPRTPFLEVQNESAEGQNGIVSSICHIVMFPIPGKVEQRLVFEFSSEQYLQMYNDFGIWPKMFLDNMNLTQETQIFIRKNGELISLFQDEHTDSEIKRLNVELTRLKQKNMRGGKNQQQGLATLLGNVCLVAYQFYPDMDIDIFLVMSITEFLHYSSYISVFFVGFLIVSLVLFQIYAKRRSRQISREHGRIPFFRELRRATLWGFLVLAVTTVIITVMSFLLGDRIFTVSGAIRRREVMQGEIGWIEKQEDFFSEFCLDIYKTRTKVTADYLKEHLDSELENHLRELSALSKTDYLMLFDNDGKEIVASNGFTGFSASGEDANLGEEFKAMVLGYPYMISGPKEDPYSGEMQIRVAVQIESEDGSRNGFLLAAYGINETKEVIEKRRVETILKYLTLEEGNIAAVINKEDGKFIAHSQEDMIGFNASNILEQKVLTGNFEGFTTYVLKPVYISSVVQDNRIYLVSFSLKSDKSTVNTCTCLCLILLLLDFIYYLFIYVACEDIKEKSEGEPLPPDGSLKIYIYGYAFYFTVVAIVSSILMYFGINNFFDVVLGGNWEPGLHLFTFWNVQFTISIMISFIVLLKKLLVYMEKFTRARGHTVINLFLNSLWIINMIVLVFYILYMLGVKVSVLLAAAGTFTIGFGMGSKQLVADILIGLFVLFQDIVHVGEKIRIDNITGTVTNLGLINIEFIDECNDLRYIRNSDVSRIVNLSRGKERRGIKLESSNSPSEPQEKRGQEGPDVEEQPGKS